MAGRRIKGIIVEIGGDTSGLQKALSKVNSATSSLSKELRSVNSLLKLDPKNTVLVKQKQELLNDEIALTSQKLEELKKHQEEVKNSGVKLNEEQQKNYRALQREIINTENKLKNLQLQASKWTTAGKTIEEYGIKIQDLGNKIDSLGNKLTAGLTVPLLTAGVIGVNSAAKQEAAVQQIEKIYGDASDTIKNFAENTALSFNMSTSDAYTYAQIYGNLIQSITDDEEKNAKYTQQLLEASSIIASATGRTMEDVMERIRSGLLGNTEAIEDLGVNVNVAMIESTDAFKKFAGDKSWLQLDFQTQQQIRLFAILEQTTKKYGDEVNKNTASDIQRLTAKFKNLTSDLSKKLLPIAEKLIDKAENFIDGLEDLTDEEQENIIKIGLMVAAAGPLIKILGTVTNVVGGTVKGIGTLSTAIGVFKTGAESANTSANKLANGFKFMASPAGIATTAITAVTVGISLLKNQIDKEMESINKASEELKNNVEIRQSSLDTINNELNANMAQIANTEQLRGELSKLVDENGRVKEGYESRVQFILNQLNNALGTEYKLNGDLIDSYDELEDSIDDLIAKKQAQLILEANEEKYKEAINNKNQAMNDYLETQNKIAEVQGKINDLQDNWQWKGSADVVMRVNEYNGQLEELQTTLQNQDKQLQEYNNAIVTYQRNSELMIEGGVENYKKIEQSVGQTQANITATANAGLTQRINDQITANAKAKELYDLEAQYNKDAKDSIYATNVEEGKKNLQALADELVSMTITTGELTPELIEAWKALATGSNEIYEETIKNMSPETRNEIENIFNAIDTDSTVKSATKELAKDAEEGFTQNVDGAEWGSDLTKEMSDSMTSNQSKSWITGAAATVAGWISDYLHHTTPDKGPMKNDDEWMPDFIENLTQGIYKNKNKLINATEKLSKDVKDKLMLDNNMNVGNLERMQGNVISKTIESTKTIYTTPQIVFNVQELDEAKLEQCFNYINRKFGSQY